MVWSTSKFQGKHVFITGGSSGIGLEIAKEVLKAGGNVTIVARTLSKLKSASQELKNLGTAGRVEVQAADVTVPQQIEKAAEAAEAALGPVDILICNAGAATPGYFHEQGLQVFDDMMKLNYFGTLYTVKAVYDGMVKRRSGHICLVSSVLGTMGFVGYSAYAPAKYAVRGLAECLRNELQGAGVSVSLAFPPDTNTPGFEHENLTKPKDTHEISSGSSVYPPDKVAQAIVKGIQKGSFICPNTDIGLALHASSVQGMVPRGVVGACIGSIVGCLAAPIQAGYAAWFDSITRKYAPQRFASLWKGASDTATGVKS